MVLATDGVIDNLYDNQIIEHCIMPHLSLNGDLSKPEDAALCISSLAEVFSYDKKSHVPFTDHAIEWKKDKEKYLGGKKDDITCVVAQVKLHR